MADEIMSRAEALDRAAKVESEKALAKANRKKERQESLTPDKSLKEMYKTTQTRANFIQGHRDEFLTIGSPEWHEWPKSVQKLRMRFLKGLEKIDFAEAKITAAYKIGDAKMIKAATDEADDIIKVCLFAHYGVNHIYTQFLNKRPDSVRPSDII